MLSTEYREDYSDLHWGKYSDPMAHYISRNLDIGDADDSLTHPDICEGWARYGRRVLSWTDQGFVYCERFDSVRAAEEWCEEQWENRGPDAEMDCIIADSRGGYYVTCEGIALGEFDDRDAAVLAVARWMVDHGTFCDAFYVNDRGNWRRIDDEIRELHDAGGDQMREDLRG